MFDLKKLALDMAAGAGGVMLMHGTGAPTDLMLINGVAILVAGAVAGALETYVADLLPATGEFGTMLVALLLHGLIYVVMMKVGYGMPNEYFVKLFAYTMVCLVGIRFALKVAGCA